MLRFTDEKEVGVDESSGPAPELGQGFLITEDSHLGGPRCCGPSGLGHRAAQTGVSVFLDYSWLVRSSL